MRISTIFANTLKLTFAAAICLLFTACPKKEQPSPADTLMGASTPTRPDFINANAGNFGPNGEPLNFGPGSGSPSDIDSTLVGRGGSGTILDPNGGVRGLVPSIYFDYDQSFIREDQRSALSETISYLNENASATLLIEGHCDFKGTTEYNLALGDRRASSVRNYLLDAGIGSSRVSVVSKGDLEAVQDGNDAQRAQDRRADIVIYE